MEYKEVLEMLGESQFADAMRGLCKIYETRRRESFIKWIENNPESWDYICHTNYEDITPKKAEEIMRSLTNTYALELQIFWLVKCENKIDALGNAIEEFESLR